MSDPFDNLPSDDLHDLAPAVAPLRGQFHTAIDALTFLRAGKAVATLKSRKTGAHFSYRLSLSNDGQCIFVGLLNGPDNTKDYKYLGYIRRDLFWIGRKVPRPGDIAPTAPSAVAFSWTWRKLIKGELPTDLEIYHEGRCGRCYRKLTHPESIERGFGPECADKL